MVDRPGISYGLFHAKVQPVKTFGIVTTAVKFPGVEMDVGHLRHLRWAKSNQQNEWVAYNRIRGQYASALEHATPERFFVDTTTCNLPTATPTSTPAFDPAKPACAEGISAVKALAVAQRQGQKVFTVTSQNIAAVLPQLSGHSQQTRADVQNAVNAGKEVTISQSRITHSGWTGAGYLVIDPQTGAGSYLIEGGANGGVFVIVLALIFVSLILPYLLFTAGVIGVPGLILGLLGAGLNFNRFVTELGKITTEAEFDSLAVRVGVQALATISLGAIGYAFYGAIPAIGSFNAMLPFNILNFAIFFYANLFRS